MEDSSLHFTTPLIKSVSEPVYNQSVFYLKWCYFLKVQGKSYHISTANVWKIQYLCTKPLNRPGAETRTFWQNQAITTAADDLATEYVSYQQWWYW